MMTSEKRKLILNLRNHSFCRVGVSKINGVGVIAVKKNPEKTSVFFKCNQKSLGGGLSFSEQELNSFFEKEIILLLKRFVAKDENNNYYVPTQGANSIDVAFYLNHAEDPNLKSGFDSRSKSEFSSLFTTKEVKEGEELTINYFKEFGKEAADQLFSL